MKVVVGNPIVLLRRASGLFGDYTLILLAIHRFHSLELVLLFSLRDRANACAELNFTTHPAYP